MNRAQQVASKNLEQAEREWLVSYGWEVVVGGFRHPKLKNERAYSLRDAVALTRADTTLGWP